MGGPRKYHNAGNGADATEVHHPDGFLDVEVVEYGAAVDAVICRLTVDCPRRVTVHPLMLVGVSLVLTTIVDERLLLERQVLHCACQCQQTKTFPRDINLVLFRKSLAVNADVVLTTSKVMIQSASILCSTCLNNLGLSSYKELVLTYLLTNLLVSIPKIL